MITPSKADDVSVDWLAIPIPSATRGRTVTLAHLAPKNMCDAHKMIIYHIREMICWPAI
jgi:hypothetical protein